MTVSRRNFLTGTAATGATLAAASLPLLPGCGNRVGAAPRVPAGVIPVTEGKLVVYVPKFPDLVGIGGAITIEYAVPAGGPGIANHGPILLIHRAPDDDSPEYVATQSLCPHQQCPLGYSPIDHLIECPCHSSRFLPVADLNIPGSCTGTVVHLPARQALFYYPVAYDAASQTVTVDLTVASVCASTQPDDMGTPSFPTIVDGKMTFAVADYPALLQVGGNIGGQPRGLGDSLIITRATEDTVTALSWICPHTGCLVEYAATRQQYECPCHGSVFAPDGALREGPATRGLKNYPTTFDGTTVVVTIS